MLTLLTSGCFSFSSGSTVAEPPAAQCVEAPAHVVGAPEKSTPQQTATPASMSEATESRAAPAIPTEQPSAAISDHPSAEAAEAESLPFGEESRHADTHLATQGPFPFNEAVPLRLPRDSPAMRYANLSAAACRSEAKRRNLPFKRDRRPTPGVATAFRFSGPIGGIRFVAGNWRTPYGVLECRLALTLAALTTLLEEHEVEQVIVGTMYRPNSKMSSGLLSQHGHALAADVVGFKLRDGTALMVEHDWPPELGAPACGEQAQVGSLTRKGVLLRNLVCDIARGGYFHGILTPNYDQPHHDHIHFDIKRGAERLILR